MKKRYIILICLIVINIILLIWLSNWRNLPKMSKYETTNTVEEKEENLNNFAAKVQVRDDKETISPQGMYHLYNVYKGKISQKYLEKKLYDFVEAIPKIYESTKELSDGNIASFYEKNKKDILKQTGITTSSEFIKLAKSIPFDGEGVSYVRSEFSFDEYTEDENYVKFDYIITYSNEKKLTTRVDLCKNGSSEKPLVSFNAK